MDELEFLPLDERDQLTRATGVQEFIRKNFGLYHPPGDYRALRAENLRRTANPSEITRRSIKLP